MELNIKKSTMDLMDSNVPRLLKGGMPGTNSLECTRGPILKKLSASECGISSKDVPPGRIYKEKNRVLRLCQVM